MFTSPAAQYFGYDEGYSLSNSFRVGISTNQGPANFTLAVSYSTDAGASYKPYGTINVVRPLNHSGILNYTYGSFVNFNFSTIKPITENFYLKIEALPDNILGAEYSGNPAPRLQIVLDAFFSPDGIGIKSEQKNTRFSFADATQAPTKVNPVPELFDDFLDAHLPRCFWSF